MVPIFVGREVDHVAIMQLKELGQLETPLPSSGIEAGTLQLMRVAYCLNQ
jgi:hypothetical protein